MNLTDSLKTSPLNESNYLFSVQNFLQLQHEVQLFKSQTLFHFQQMCLQNQQLTLYQHQVNSLQLKLTELQREGQNYDHLLLKDMAEEFISSFQSPKTRTTYSEGFAQLYQQGYLQPQMSLGEFRNLNGETVLDDVRQNYKCKKNKGQNLLPASESTKQLRAAMLISFSTFLQRRTNGFIRRITPNKFGFNKTFRHRREKTLASRLSSKQIDSFLACLKTFSMTAYLFASLQLIGVKRVSEVIQVKIEDLDLPNRRIFFHVLKTRGLLKENIVVYLPPKLTAELKAFINDRQNGFLFLHTAQQIPITKDCISKLYRRGWNLVQTTSSTVCSFRPKMITHSLRAAGISYLYEKGIDSQLIKEISGHSSGDMVMYYNTKSKLDNVTKRICIFDLD